MIVLAALLLALAALTSDAIMLYCVFRVPTPRFHGVQVAVLATVGRTAITGAGLVLVAWAVGR